MQSMLKAVLRAALRVLFRGVIGRSTSEPFQRAWIHLVSATTLTAAGSHTETVRDPLPAAWVRHRDSRDDRVVLYLHGGGYTLGSHATHKAITSHLARAARAAILVPDYRLAPEHPYPAPLDDAMAAYRSLLGRHPPSCIAIAGDSAGGGLALCLAIALRDAPLPLPAALVLISPWTDLTLSGESMTRVADIDPMLGRDWLARAAEAFRGALPADDPRVSPLHADLRRLPRTLVQAASDEILLSDAERFVDKARAAGVDIVFEREDGFWHDFQLHAGVLDAADAAIARIAAFLDAAWAAAPST